MPEKLVAQIKDVCVGDGKTARNIDVFYDDAVGQLIIKDYSPDRGETEPFDFVVGFVNGKVSIQGQGCRSCRVVPVEGKRVAIFIG